ncbi:autotransporter outer membrane beta-barrel domain-containing protein [Pontibacter silvestris]|uniref:Autotransporter outer membrane beta-barrel domain-containing protein n=1 Tax=Pontibacter silvestris TaxID=2305183 RepID=A0ABW4WZE3_9BACT|nr:autotransporter outer membrane beta-barrel domain-containing protein [Pontibacter silvestris]MCC9136805.1 autotransporter outer membrane beta-barrel domain-containing protein [Pontibacter silvestris]
MRKTLLLLFSLLLVGTTMAQDMPTPEPKKGYAGMVEIGYLYGKIKRTDYGVSTNSSVASPSVQFFNGYRFHRLFTLGGTLGFDSYDNILATPVALGIRGEMFKTRVSPTYSLDTGYGFTFISEEESLLETKGGWMFNPSLGLRASTGNSSAFTFQVGYKSQRVTTESVSWDVRREQKIHYKRLSLRIGFIF